MRTTSLGFPNVYQSLIKNSVEGFWSGKNDSADILEAEKKVVEFNAQAQASLDLIPVGDVDIYDRLLRTAVMFGVIPRRFGSVEQVHADVGAYLSIPRGTAHAFPSPMVKWFDTNYHVRQPEIEQLPVLVSSAKIPNFSGGNKKMALIGPWTFLSYAINKSGESEDVLFSYLSAEYSRLLNALPKGVVQLEEPSFLVRGIPAGYAEFLAGIKQDVHLHVYFGSVNEFADELFSLPVAGFGLDFVDGKRNRELLDSFPKDKTLIAGVINGRNVWPVSARTKEILSDIVGYIPEDELFISPSCSLMHVPVSAKGEEGFFSFAVEKIAELNAIKQGTIRYSNVSGKEGVVQDNRFARSRKQPWVSDTAYPTTTIGSFPQTRELRSKRAAWKSGKISGDEYHSFIRAQIRECIRAQEVLGLDVLVHGEFERSDMVEYFAENLEGFIPIKGGVQSYGTKHVRPPVIVGVVKRKMPFTVDWIQYAQSLTPKPVKGMITGPVTLVQWSYPREDISKEAQFYDCAEPLRGEVSDLVHAGVKHIQIDEPALREGLPIDKEKRAQYLYHAVNAFRSVFAQVPDDVVIHSHMCFSDFNLIMDAINHLGVDVLSIEDSNGQGKIAAVLKKGGFPASIGLGVYDVHSPRIPTVEEMVKIPLSLSMDARRIWINPDCGLKTRGPEAYQQLEVMMQAAKFLREKKQGE